MFVVTWTLLGISAAAFALAGIGKLFGDRNEKTLQRQPWMSDFAPGQVRLIGLAESLGAVGLVAPFGTGILPWLTPLAGLGLVLVMLGAMTTHARRREWKQVPVNAFLAALAAAGGYMAYARI
jgi:hypothetical protein